MSSDEEAQKTARKSALLIAKLRNGQYKVSRETRLFSVVLIAALCKATLQERIQVPPPGPPPPPPSHPYFVWSVIRNNDIWNCRYRNLF